MVHLDVFQYGPFNVPPLHFTRVRSGERRLSLLKPLRPLPSMHYVHIVRHGHDLAVQRGW